MLELRQDAGAELAVRHLAAAKPDGGFHFVANLQPFACPLHAIAVIMLVRAGTKLHFLNDDYRLFLFRLVGFFLGFYNIAIFAYLSSLGNHSSWKHLVAGITTTLISGSPYVFRKPAGRPFRPGAF